MMTNITPEALIGAVVTEVDAEDDCIYEIKLRLSDGRYVELYGMHEYVELWGSRDAWMEVL